jgi:molybdopterin synthase sulfur carrier subunit
MPRVTVRYFAAARAAAGTIAETVEAGCIDDALISLCSRHDERFTLVLKASSLLLDGTHVRDGQAALVTDVDLDVLPPFAGG